MKVHRSSFPSLRWITALLPTWPTHRIRIRIGIIYCPIMPSRPMTNTQDSLGRVSCDEISPVVRSPRAVLCMDLYKGEIAHLLGAAFTSQRDRMHSLYWCRHSGLIRLFLFFTAIDHASRPGHWIFSSGCIYCSKAHLCDYHIWLFSHIQAYGPGSKFPWGAFQHVEDILE